jgi:hypothetical protein
MKKHILALAAAAITSLALASSAQAATPLDMGNVGQYCVNKYSSNATGERPVMNRYGQAVVACRLAGTTYGYVIHNQSVDEVCTFLTGRTGWTNVYGRITCDG